MQSDDEQDGRRGQPDEPDMEPCYCGENAIGNRVHNPRCPAHESDDTKNEDAGHPDEPPERVYRYRRGHRAWLSKVEPSRMEGVELVAEYDRVDGAVEDAVDAPDSVGQNASDGERSGEKSAAATDAPPATEKWKCPECGHHDSFPADSTPPTQAAWHCIVCGAEMEFVEQNDAPDASTDDATAERMGEALDNRTEDLDELVRPEDIDVDSSDIEVSLGESGVGGPEPAAWRSSCGNEDCDWHNKHFRKPSVQNKTCPWCGDEEVRLEPYAFTGEQFVQEKEKMREDVINAVYEVINDHEEYIRENINVNYPDCHPQVLTVKRLKRRLEQLYGSDDTDA